MAEPVTAAALRHKPAPGAVDPDTKIPRAVIEAGKRAEELQRQSTGTAEPSVIATPETPQPETPPPETPPQEPPEQHEPEPQNGEPMDWERRFKGLQGRYDRDVRQTREQLNQMSESLNRLQHENATLRQPAPSATPTPPPSLLSEQEIADYGPEFVDVVRRVAREIATPLETEIVTLRNQLGYVQQETGNSFLNRMDETIGGIIKNWREINTHPRFVEWVKLPDVFSGAIRQTLMQEAWNAGDARRVAAFFQAFLAEEAAVDPQRANGQGRPASRMSITPTPSPVTAPQAAPSLALEDLAAPGRAHSAATPAEKPVYTSADIARFYTDVKLGRWRGREQQQAAIDADIMLAGREGRVIVDQRSVLPMNPNGAVR